MVGLREAQNAALVKKKLPYIDILLSLRSDTLKNHNSPQTSSSLLTLPSIANLFFYLRSHTLFHSS